jgi:tetratricopeptide (TPR) repeat protein
VRRLLAVALALLGLAAGSAGSRARASDLVVLPPVANADARVLARGAAEWTRGRLEEAGLASAPGFALAAELPVDRTRVVPDVDQLRVLASSYAAERAWVLELAVTRGRADVRIALLDLASGAAIAAGHADASVAELGASLASAVDGLLAGLGVARGVASVPALPELAALGRATEILEAGRLADAYRALAGTRSHGARLLRARVESAVDAPTLPVSERARLDVARGEAERARLLLRAQLGENPDDAGLVLAAGEAAADLGEPARAIPFFDRALELEPASKAARDGRASALVQLGRVAEAAPLLEGAEPAVLDLALRTPALDPATRGALHLSLARAHALRFDVERAQENFDRAAASDAALAAPVQRSAALLHAGFGNFERALAPAEAAAAQPDADAPVWQALGSARLATGDASGARTAFDRAHALAPQDPEPLRGLAEAAQQTGDTEQATTSLQQALAIAPGDAPTRRRLAGLLRVSGRIDEALALLDGQPGDPHPALLHEVASIRSERGDVAGAAAALEHAMQLAPADPTVVRDLAALREQSGDASGAATLRQITASDSVPAEAGAAATAESPATLSGLEELAASFPSQLPGRRERLRAVALLAPSRAREPGLVERILAPKRLSVEVVGDAIAQALAAHFEVVSPREIPTELAAVEQAALRAFAEDETAVAHMNHALGTDAVFFARVDVVETAAGETGVHVELRMGVGTDPLAVQRFANQTWIAGGATRFGVWNPTALIVLSLASIGALLPLLRGWGQLQVGLQYASLGKGFFSIRITRRSIKADLGAARGKAERRYLKKMRLMGRYERAMVGKETSFRWLPARRYYVTVHGLLQDPGTDAVIGSYAAEQVVVVERGKTARLDFDFRAQEAAIEVSIFDGEATAPLKVKVALRGVPDSMRYAHGGRSIFYVAPGVHRVLVGTGGRVLERQIRIDECAARTLAFDLQDESCRVFDGCPEAVEAYLVGNLAAAADALEENGQETAAANVRGEHFASIGETEKAARAFQRAGRFEEAATLLSGDVDPRAAAELYEQAGNHEKAATAWEEAGDVVRAARHYETAYRYDDALECYRRAGLVEKVCELLEKLARHFEAAGSALELGDADRAIRDLQMIDLRDPDYGRACQMLGRIFAERGEHDLAVQKLAEAVEVGGGDTAPLEAVEQLARAQEQAGLFEAAVQTWEAIRARDFHYPDASTRIESLRGDAESARATRAALTLARGVESPAGAEESRYEILGELGRGGMGVVFKARDKRLGRVVALKRLPDNLRNHPTAVRLFLREARAAAALNHRNIVTLFDAGQEGDQYFLTMELLEGLPLHDLLGRRGKLSARDAARLGAQACAGLDYAHGQGVVHRDIKTSNLFFTRDRVVKIMDFGLAKMTEEVRRAATVVGGTPYYMAPEQAAGDDVDPRADQYALGVTLFELVTGDVPFKTGDVTYHHRHTAPPDPRAAAPDLPEALVTLILRLMAKRPDERFARVGEAGAELQRIARQLAD